jgi:hypothetical protein
MSHPNWNKIDQFSESFPIYDCVYLDILGYKERVAEYFGNQYNLFGRINRALEKAEVVFTLTAPLLDTSELSIEIISDSIIIFQPVKQHGLAKLLLHAAILTALLNCEGLFLRGGIARGKHCRRKTEQGFNFLASQALQKAYALEQKANFARILVEPEIVTDLAPEEKGLIVRENNEFILHFANHVINREANNSNYVHAEMTELLSSIKNQSDEKIKAKHRWLLDYYHWTITQNPKWDALKFTEFAPPSRGFSFLT